MNVYKSVCGSLNIESPVDYYIVRDSSGGVFKVFQPIITSPPSLKFKPHKGQFSGAAMTTG